MPIVFAEGGSFENRLKKDDFVRGREKRELEMRALYDRLLAEGWKGLVYLPKNELYDDSSEGSMDRVHPNDLGMKTMTEAFTKAVREALALPASGGPRAELHGGTTVRDGSFRFEDFYATKPAKPADATFAFHDLSNRFATARVSLYGAQVVSYRPAGGSEVLFQPRSMPFRDGGEVHGGIPLCWPSFCFSNVDAGTPQHGFARYSHFRVGSTRRGDGYDEVVLVLESNEETIRRWPHEFRLEVKLTLTDRLLVTVTTRNTGKTPFVITEALHAYFRVADVRKCALRGLVTDPGDGFPCTCAFRPSGSCWGSVGAWRPELVLEDEVEKRTVGICAAGNNSIVTWNAGDFPKTKQNLVRAEWPKYLCVEPANLEERGSVTVAPGADHVLQLMVVSK